MKFKVGDKWYDGELQPIMVLLTEKDKENIKNMHPEATKYAMFPDDIGLSDEEIEVWMGMKEAPLVEEGQLAMFCDKCWQHHCTCGITHILNKKVEVV